MTHAYLAPYVGAGTEADPFRPRGAEQPDWAAIDLRPDSRILSGVALMRVPVRDDTIGMYLGDDPDVIVGAVRASVQSRLGLVLRGARLRDIIPELLIEHAREDGTRWRPLKPMRDGMFRIYLGGLFWQARVLRGGSTITESFNKADSTTLGPDLSWTEITGDASVVSNQIKLAADGVICLDRANTDLASADHYAQMVLLELARTGAVGVHLGVICRKDSTATATFYYYRCLISTTVNQHEMYKDVSGTFTQLGSTDGTDFAAGEVVSVQANGSSITAFRNRSVSVGPVTDTSISGNTRGGVRGVSSGTDIARGNAFRAGDLSDIRTLNVANNATPGGSHATSIAVTIPSTTAGTCLVVMAHAGDDPTAVPEVSSVAATGVTFVKQGGVLNSTGTRSVRTECWIARNVPSGITTVTVTWPSAIVGVVTVGEYVNVKSLGHVATATGSAAHPSISVVTQDTDNFVVAGFTNEDTAQSSFSAASRGTFWTQNYGLGDGNPDVAGCLVDNAFPTAGSLACTLLYPNAVMWAAIAVELRSVVGTGSLVDAPILRNALVGGGLVS